MCTEKREDARRTATITHLVDQVERSSSERGPRKRNLAGKGLVPNATCFEAETASGERCKRKRVREMEGPAKNSDVLQDSQKLLA